MTDDGHSPDTAEGARAAEMAEGGRDRYAPARTMLEAKIRTWNMTYEEFSEYAENVARGHGESGTLSVRQLQRLATQPQSGACPRPATRRLLERIFDTPVEQLLAAPADRGSAPEAERDEISSWERQVVALDREMIAAQRLDPDTLELFVTQLDTTRRLDRRFGAASLVQPLRLHIDHVETLFTHSTTGATVRALAAVLTEAHALAAWQALDLGRLTDAWHHSRRACDTARAAESPAVLAHALAEQTVILADAGHTAESAELADHARNTGARSSALLRSWLAAAHGEALAAHGQRDACLCAFDDAAHLLPEDAEPEVREPYVALAPGHLVRWRGHALARFGHPDAVEVLQAALASHDMEFTRAEAGLHTDLATALLSAGDPDGATRHYERGRSVADTVRSARQRRRLDTLPL